MNEDSQQFGSVFSFGQTSPLDPASRSPHPGTTFAPIGDEFPENNYAYAQREGVTDTPSPIVTVGPGETLTPILALREDALPPKHEAYQSANAEFRGAWNQYKYRTQYAFIPDFAAGTNRQIEDIQTDFQVWAYVLIPHRVIDPGTGDITGPFNSGLVMPVGAIFPSAGIAWQNLPTGGKFQYMRAVTGAAIPGTGWDLVLFDRWIPSAGSFS